MKKCSNEFSDFNLPQIISVNIFLEFFYMHIFVLLFLKVLVLDILK